jgi:hypothetical protein
MKVTYRVRVSVLDMETDFGLGPGVLGYQDIDFELSTQEEKKHPAFLAALMEHANLVLENFIKLEVGEIVDET